MLMRLLIFSYKYRSSQFSINKLRGGSSNFIKSTELKNNNTIPKIILKIIIKLNSTYCIRLQIQGGSNMEARHGVEQVSSHVHLPVSSACTLYVAPEDGCILHPKHVEQKV